MILGDCYKLCLSTRYVNSYCGFVWSLSKCHKIQASEAIKINAMASWFVFLLLLAAHLEGKSTNTLLGFCGEMFPVISAVMSKKSEGITMFNLIYILNEHVILKEIIVAGLAALD